MQPLMIDRWRPPDSDKAYARGDVAMWRRRASKDLRHWPRTGPRHNQEELVKTMRHVSFFTRLRRHGFVPCILLATLLALSVAGFTPSAIHANARASTELDLLNNNGGRVL